MTESTTWLSIVADDLSEIRGQIAAGNSRWSDDDVLCRLVWDMAAGMVGLAQEMRSEHMEAVKIWGRHASTRTDPAAPVSPEQGASPYDLVEAGGTLRPVPRQSRSGDTLSERS